MMKNRTLLGLWSVFLILLVSQSVNAENACTSSIVYGDNSGGPMVGIWTMVINQDPSDSTLLNGIVSDIGSEGAQIDINSEFYTLLANIIDIDENLICDTGKVSGDGELPACFDAYMTLSVLNNYNPELMSLDQLIRRGDDKGTSCVKFKGISGL